MGWVGFFYQLTLTHPLAISRLSLLLTTNSTDHLMWPTLATNSGNQLWASVIAFDNDSSKDHLQWSTLMTTTYDDLHRYSTSDDQLRRRPHLITINLVATTSSCQLWWPALAANSDDQLGRPTPKSPTLSFISNSNDQLD